MRFSLPKRYGRQLHQPCLRYLRQNLSRFFQLSGHYQVKSLPPRPKHRPFWTVLRLQNPRYSPRSVQVDDRFVIP